MKHSEDVSAYRIMNNVLLWYNYVNVNLENGQFRIRDVTTTDGNTTLHLLPSFSYVRRITLQKLCSKLMFPSITPEQQH